MGKRGRAKVSNKEVRAEKKWREGRKRIADEAARAVYRTILTQPREVPDGALPAYGTLLIAAAYIAPRVMVEQGIPPEIIMDDEVRASVAEWMANKMMTFSTEFDLDEYRQSEWYNPKIDPDRQTDQPDEKREGASDRPNETSTA